MASFLILLTSLVILANTSALLATTEQSITADIDPSSLIQIIFSLMSYDDLQLLNPITSTLPISDIYNVTKWRNSNMNSPYLWEAIISDASDRCSKLNLSSSSCQRDCTEYNSPPKLLYLAISTNSSHRLRSIEVIKWYAVSGGPTSWYDVGNEDMCRYFEGKYLQKMEFYIGNLTVIPIILQIFVSL